MLLQGFSDGWGRPFRLFRRPLPARKRMDTQVRSSGLTPAGRQCSQPREGRRAGIAANHALSANVAGLAALRAKLLSLSSSIEFRYF